MPYATPEEAIQDGIYNRLTHATDGLTITAGKYCSNIGAINRWQGDVTLDWEGIVQWGKAGVATGTSPAILIIAGGSADYDQDHAQVAIGTFTIQIVIACRHLRSPNEALAGDAGGATRAPGVWQIRDDILDRLLNFGIVTGEDPPWVTGGRLLRTEKNFALYELDMKIRVGRIYTLTPYAGLSGLTGVDTTIQQEDSGTTDDGIPVAVKNDTP